MENSEDMHRRPPQGGLECQGILFDLDGVLVDSRSSVDRMWARWAEAHGFEPEKIMPVVHGRRAIDTIRLLLKEAADEEVLASARRLEDWEVEDARTVTAMPGAAALLASLPRERWAIVTSGALRLAKARIAAAGIPLPQVLVCADDVKNGKPDPEGYLAAARRLGAEPARCVVCEDAPAGLQAAHAGGMRAIAVATTHAPEELQPAEFCVASVAELKIDGTPGGFRIAPASR